MMDKRQAKELVTRAGKELVHSGLIARTWGNVSCRINETSFAITASGRNYLTLTEEEVIEVKLSDLSYEGEITPSSEKRIHAGVYELLPEAGFVIHTHQENASAISAMGLSSIPLDKEYAGLGREIICADYALPGTKSLSKNTMAAVKKSVGKAVILRHHGALCYGADYEEAFAIAHRLEEACGDYLVKIAPWMAKTDISPDREMPRPAASYALWNTSPLVMAFLELSLNLPPCLDDFAQIVGPKAIFTENKSSAIEKALKKNAAVLVRGVGALCTGATMSDAEAVSMILEKNCKAYFAAGALGRVHPINPAEAALMRAFYLKKYSKLY